VKLVLRCMSLKQRQNLAAKMRAGSKAHIENSMEQIMDVNAGAVTKAFEQFGVDLMIHGHTHRPAVHSLTVDGKPATRIVLGDWYTQGSVLRWDERGFELESLKRGQEKQSHAE
jgi:UDP-2,3-diacylglucosamine hydrolase